jgi:hypothetical protein
VTAHPDPLNDAGKGDRVVLFAGDALRDGDRVRQEE